MPFEHTCNFSILFSLVVAQIEPFITEHSPVIRPSVHPSIRPSVVYSLSSIFLILLLLTAGSSHYVIISTACFWELNNYEYSYHSFARLPTDPFSCTVYSRFVLSFSVYLRDTIPRSFTTATLENGYSRRRPFSSIQL